MSILDRKKITDVKIEKGEEALYQEYNLKTVDRTLNALIGIDGGSTQTRCLIVDNMENVDETLYSIPSVASFVPSDVEIRSQGTLLYQNMDSVLRNNSDKVSTTFSKIRVVRGTKKLDHNGAEQRISSTSQKIQTDLFYINIIDAIGYALCMKYKDQIPSQVKLAIGVALPPDDRNSTVNVNTFLNNLLGSYTWSLTEYDVKINIEIENCSVRTEPEAFANAAHIAVDEEFPEVELHCNMGGRSTGVELLVNGHPISAVSTTFPYGGAQLADKLGFVIANTRGGRAPQYRALKSALETGNLKDGTSVIPVVKEITQVKEEVAKKLKADIIKYVFDAQSDFTPKDVSVFSVSGRAFNGGDYEVSIADFLQEEFKVESPHTEFEAISENYIPLGLALAVYDEYGALLENDEIE